MTPDDLSALIADVLADVTGVTRNTHDDIALERPRNREHGDWASSVALKLAKELGTSPRQLGEQLAERLTAVDGIKQVDVAGPGFLNITLDAASAGEIARDIVEAGATFGTSQLLADQSINLEFVSANPTGPLHLGHTRWAALGDSMARVLKAAGAKVATEFYINDAGSQMQKFGRSVLAAALGRPAPADAYPGEYIHELGARVLERVPNLADLEDDRALEVAQEEAYQLQLGDIQASLRAFRVHFDVWFSERSLFEVPEHAAESALEGSITRLRKQGHVYESDGAVWVRTTDFGDDKDRVVRRGNGEYTYFASDAAYYLSKKDRGFIEKIYLLGADHHGYIGRLKALAGAAGDDPEKNVTVLIGQLVQLNGARLSKRAGNIIELDDLLEWLGVDALRFWLARYPADSPLSLDGESLKAQSNDNPVFYVQYAHARTCAVQRNASASGVDRSEFEPGLFVHASEGELLAALAQYPQVVERAATLREPHRIARYLEELAGFYHRWYDSCRVIPQGDAPVETVHRTRLWLNDATQTVLRNGLELIGVSAPERM